MNHKVREAKLIYKGALKNAPQIRKSADAFNILRQDWDDCEVQESFKILLLNRANRVIGKYEVSKGGITGTIVDTRLVMCAAIKGLACAIILAHNHPSGNKKPSQADLDISKKLVQAGKILDIVVLDHLIITDPGEDNGYYAFSEDGLM